MNHNEILKTLGKLASIFTDSEVLEIMVDDPLHVIVDRNGELTDSGIQFESEAELRTLIDEVLALGGVKLSSEKTSGHIRFPDGSRMLAVIPPTALNGPYLVLRKNRTNHLSMEDLIRWNSISQEQYQFLQNAIQARQNILIAGGTGSGKTTFANILIDEFPPRERIITVEAINELNPKSRRIVRLIADNSPDHSFADLIDLASKMRPDRLVIGELTGPEALKTLEIFNRGHDGSLATLHAANPEDALARLESMCLMANLGLGLSEIRILIASAIQVITYQQHLPNGRRRLTQIVELQGLESGRYALSPLFRYNAETDTIAASGAQPGWQASPKSF